MNMISIKLCAADDEFIGLGDLAGGSFSLQTYGVNADGSVPVRFRP
jgi:hypothetical protein